MTDIKNKIAGWLDKLFGGINMTWLKVVIFAVATGVYTGLVMIPDFLDETSFQDIGVSYEWWVVFAVIVVVNCKKWYGAALKCFVFFVISQPLVYAVEVLLGSLDIDMAIMYYTKIWLPATFLTLPGGIIAYFCAKQNVIGAIILGLGNTIQMSLGVYYIKNAVQSFPDHILTAIFCFVSAVVMTFFIQKKKSGRIISLALPVAITLFFIIAAKLAGLDFIL